MRRAILVLCALMSLFSPFSASARDTRELLDQAFANRSTLGACVAVIQNGEITFTHTYGKRSPQGAAVTEDTVFLCGSISKMVGNIGLMRLMTERGISLDTELGDLLGFPVRNPKYPNTELTLRQVMTHTASLQDGRFYWRALLEKPTPVSEVFTEKAESAFWKHEPGTKREYSNFGGGLIGILIETLSGMEADEYMQKHVFEPLGITAGYRISSIPQEVPAADVYHMPDGKQGRVLRKTGIKAAYDPERNYDLTAGKLIISAPDLAKLLIALCDGGICGDTRILSESVVSEMLTPQNHRGSVRCETGSGLFVNILTDRQVEGRTLYGHGGKAYGMLCAAYFDPADRTGVVMLTNGCDNSPSSTGVGALGREILTLCYEHIIEPSHEVKDPFAVE